MHDNSSINIVLLVTGTLLANSACAVNLLEKSGTLVSHFNPSTPESDQSQTSPAASPEKVHNTV